MWRNKSIDNASGSQPQEGRSPATDHRAGRVTMPSELDPLALPTVVEEESESAWAQFEALMNADKTDFDHTRSSVLEPRPSNEWSETVRAAPKSVRPKALRLMPELHEVLALVRKDNRTSPNAQAWRQFHALLASMVDEGWSDAPPPPLDLAQSTPLQRRLRLRDQIEWADLSGCLAQAQDFLADLADDQWVHFEGRLG